MPNTKSAERRVRNSARRQLINHRTLSRLKTLEGKYRDLLGKGDQSAVQTALRDVVSALDKAAKSGVIPKARADRKKSRLALGVNAAATAKK